jgi:hypothetical protein
MPRHSAQRGRLPLTAVALLVPDAELEARAAAAAHDLDAGLRARRTHGSENFSSGGRSSARRLATSRSK